MNQQTSSSRKVDYSAPPIHGDFYRIGNLLNDAERAVVKRVRDFMEREIAPIIEGYWARDNFPSRSSPSSPHSGSAA
jgi:glutaryl-CoA dehydrogenase